MNNVIEIKGLSKSFGKIKAVDDISFSVREGELFAFLGVNGAGKSTSISVIIGQIKKDAGKVIILGRDTDHKMPEIKSELGVVFQNSALDKDLSVIDNLRIRAALYGIVGDEFEKKISELSEKLGFADIMTRTVRRLSGGQRRRVDIARALIHSPKILILDEPTTGLDPQSRKQLWDVISTLRKEQGMTVFLTTHYMEEAAEADDIVVLSKGKIVASGTPLELKNKYSSDTITLYNVSEDDVKQLGYRYEVISGAYKISVPDTKIATSLITAHPELFCDYEIVKGKMDDVFISLTGGASDGGERK